MADNHRCLYQIRPFDIGTIFATAPLEPTEAEVDAELKKQGKVVAAKAKAEADDDVNTSDDGADATGAFGREDEDVRCPLLLGRPCRRGAGCRRLPTPAALPQIKPFINKKKSGGGVVKGSSFTAVKGKGKGRMLDSDDEDFVPSDEIVPWWKEDRIMMDPRHRQHRKKLFETLGLEEDEEIEPSTKMKALLALLKTSVRPSFVHDSGPAWSAISASRALTFTCRNSSAGREPGRQGGRLLPVDNDARRFRLLPGLNRDGAAFH